MAEWWKAEKDTRRLLMGNDALARGAVEAGVRVAAGYPGTPSSEIIENLARASRDRDIYVEWSVNEKVALEVAAAASYAGLRSLAVMKQVGMNVAADFLLHLAQYGTRGGMVIISCEDPGALSSTNEGESRPYAKMMEFSLLEPGDFQEAKDMVRWAFTFSEEIRCPVMVRSVTRLSHASGNVIMGDLPEVTSSAHFEFKGGFMDPMTGPVINLPGIVEPLKRRQHERLDQAARIMDESSFNTYSGPERPELLVITSSTCTLYCKEAIDLLNVEDRVGLLKLGTTWPLPRGRIQDALSRADRVLIVEEVQPFLEDNVLALAAILAPDLGVKAVSGKHDGAIPSENELNPDVVIAALTRLLDVGYEAVQGEYVKRAAEIAETGAPVRELTFCPGCPHRASFYSIHRALAMDHRDGFVCGDIGCYSLAAIACGFNSLKTLHSMGSGLGLASGFGKLGPFGLDQPIFAVCGDSTFYHAVMPALVNAVHNHARITLVVLDNRGTAMTGFQAHPGLDTDALGGEAAAVDIPEICRAVGAEVTVCDPFDLEETQDLLLDMIDRDGVKVVVMRQACALSPQKKGRKRFEVSVNTEACLGETCGCNRLCTRIFKCPGLLWDPEAGAARIDEVICAGCGVCASICPAGAIERKEVA